MKLVSSILVTETVDGAALTLEGVDDVEGGDSLALGVLAVEGRIFDDTFQEGAEGLTTLVIDQARQTLDTTTTGHTTNRGLGNTGDVIGNETGAASTTLALSHTGFTAFADASFAAFATFAVTELSASNARVLNAL